MTDNGSGAAKIELDVLTEFQRHLHKHEGPDEDIPSKFNYVFRKTTWSVNLIEEMEAAVKNDGKVITYTCNHKYDFLLYSYIIQRIQPMKVNKEARKKVQICLCHNPGHNIIVNGALDIDGIVVQSFGSGWLDIHSQFFMEPGFRENYNVAIGNVPFLEQWSTHIPAYELTVHQPFFYSKNTATALPLFLGSLGRVTHRYEFKRDLSQLLRMRILEDESGDQWREIQYNWEYMAAVAQDEKFSQPVMFGKYAVITEAERNWHKGIVAVEDVNTGKIITKTDPNYRPLVMYGENVVETTHENSYTFGNTVGIDLTSATPTKSIFWVAENIDATKLNNHSNYTTNSKDIMNGWSPISDISMGYGNVIKIKSMSNTHFNVGLSAREFMSPPSEPGYNGINFGYNINSLHADVGIVFNQIGMARFNANLADTDPFLKKVVDKRRKSRSNPDDFVPRELMTDDKKSARPSNFKLRVFLLTSTRITLPSNGKMIVDSGVVPGPKIKDLSYE